MRGRRRLLGWDRLEDRTCQSAIAAVGPPASTVPVAKPSAADLWQASLDARYAADIKADVAFFGDSISYNFGYVDGLSAWARKIAPLKAVDYGVPGDMTQNLLWRLKNTKELANPPKVAVVEIGLNNIVFGGDSPGAVLAGIKKVIQTIRSQAPRTQILVLGIFPTNEPTSWYRAEENTVNAFLARLADGRTIRYLNAGQAYVAADGSIAAATTSGLIHPNARGYEIIADAIVPTLQSMLAAAGPAGPGVLPRGR